MYQTLAGDRNREFAANVCKPQDIRMKRAAILNERRDLRPLRQGRANFLAVNLADDIVNNRRSVEDARRF